MIHSVEPASRKELIFEIKLWRETRSCLQGTYWIRIWLWRCTAGFVRRNDSKILHVFACWEVVIPPWMLDSLWEREIPAPRAFQASESTLIFLHLVMPFKGYSKPTIRELIFIWGAGMMLAGWSDMSFLWPCEVQEKIAFPTSPVYHLPSPAVMRGSTCRTIFVVPEKSLLVSLLTFQDVTPSQGGSCRGSPWSCRGYFPSAKAPLEQSNKSSLQQVWARL